MSPLRRTSSACDDSTIVGRRSLILPPASINCTSVTARHQPAVAVSVFSDLRCVGNL